MKNYVFLFLVFSVVSFCKAQVGSGTVTVDADLHIKNNDDSNPELKIESEDTQDNATLLFHTKNDALGGASYFDAMRINAGWHDTASILYGDNRLSIEGYNGSVWNSIANFKANGNVGIGITEPTAPLHIFNTAVLQPGMHIESDDDVSLRIESNLTGTPGVHGEVYLEFQNSSSATDGWMMGMNDEDDFFIGSRALGSMGNSTGNQGHELEFRPSSDTDDWLHFKDYIDAGSTNHGYSIYPDLDATPTVGFPHISGSIGIATHIFEDGFFTDLYRNTETAISDRRVKTNIKPIKKALTTLTKLEGVSYKINTDKHPYLKNNKNQREDNTKQYGFIAQDLKKVIPEMVVFDGSIDLNTVRNYEQLLPFLVEALKELNAKVDTLTDKQKQLLAENEALLKELTLIPKK